MKPATPSEYTYLMAPGKWSAQRADLLEWALRRLLQRHTIRRRKDAIEALRRPA